MGEADGIGVAPGEGVGIALGAGVALGIGVADGIGVALSAGVGLGAGLIVGVGLTVAVGDGVWARAPAPNPIAQQKTVRTIALCVSEILRIVIQDILLRGTINRSA